MGRYRVEGVLGQGQAGIVYRGFDTTIERTVAIKCLRSAPGENGKPPTGAEAAVLLEEAKMIGKLNHPHVASVYDMGTFSNQAFIVMEYVEGETLNACLLQKGRHSNNQILDLIVMIARALHYVHQRGILHGDIKPANIIITPPGTPKIMDFGVARRSLSGEPSSWSLVGEELVRGTPGYLAPEQLTANEVDSRADVFSLGVIAYEWLAGRPPFWGRTPRETMQAVVAGRARPLVETGRFAPELSQIVDQALATNPEQRFRSADAFADALEVYQEQALERPAKTAPAGPLETARPSSFPRSASPSVYFADFSAEELAAVMELSRHERFEPGDAIIREGTGGSTMYVVVEGLVSVRKAAGSESVEIGQRSVGDGFGEMSVISQLPRSATVVALRPTEVIAISGAVLRLANPVLCMKLYRNIASLLSERVREADQQVAKLTRNESARATR